VQVVQVLRRLPVVKSLGDKVLRAEVMWVLKTVESNFSFNASEDIVEVLQQMDPDSLVLKTMRIKKDKVSYVLSHGLYPFYKEKLARRIQGAVGFTLGTDSATFKLQGLSKLVDIVIRYFDEVSGEVVDEFLDTTSVGHEPADVQVQHIKASLQNSDIHLYRMLCLSRDNPNVMKRVFKLLEAEVVADKCPMLLDAPCLLHPTHTAYKKAVKALDQNLMSLLGNLHSFFKTSTARREDMVEVREEMAQVREEEAEEMEEVYTEVLDQFFLRHVDTRWLESGPAIQRLLDHWPSTVKYFMDYLPNSPLQNNKVAVSKKKYKAIAAFLGPGEEDKTKARAKFLALLAGLTKSFLTLLQAVKPMVHKLLPLAKEMFCKLAALVFKPEARPRGYTDIKNLKLKDTTKLLDPTECGFMSCCREEVSNLDREDRRAIRLELRKAVVQMLAYLQNNIPWDSALLKKLAFLDPDQRNDAKTAEYGVDVAKILNRFSEEELGKLVVQLTTYQALPEEKVPRFVEKAGHRIDHHWVKLVRVLEETMGTRPRELETLMKLCCTIAHGNAFLERGMSTTKQVVEGRSSLSNTSVKATKTLRQVIARHGTKVPVTRDLLAFVAKSKQKYVEELNKKKEEEAKTAKTAAEDAEENRKRKADEANMVSWTGKKIELEHKIKSSQAYLKSQQRVQSDAMEKGLNLKNSNNMKISMMAANLARKNIDKEHTKLTRLQEEMVVLVSKKPKKTE